MSQITTHVLDTSKGRPAAGITVRLAALNGDRWTELDAVRTGADGRAAGSLPPNSTRGTFRLRFEVADYFAQQGVTAFYPYVDVVFEVRDDSHYHVPLLLSPFGYSTYRGS